MEHIFSLNNQLHKSRNWHSSVFNQLLIRVFTQYYSDNREINILTSIKGEKSYMHITYANTEGAIRNELRISVEFK